VCICIHTFYTICLALEKSFKWIVSVDGPPKFSRRFCTFSILFFWFVDYVRAERIYAGHIQQLYNQRGSYAQQEKGNQWFCMYLQHNVTDIYKYVVIYNQCPNSIYIYPAPLYFPPYIIMASLYYFIKSTFLRLIISHLYIYHSIIFRVTKDCAEWWYKPEVGRVMLENWEINWWI
jgi:hypothetical protein